VVTIEQQAFNGCNLLNVAATPNVESLGTSAFYGCSALSAIDTLKVKVLGGFSLYQCASLSVLEFGGEITSVGNSAMEKCTSLQKVIVRASTPPTLGNTNAFNNTNNCPIYVPDASLEAYKTATNWVSYADRIHPLSEIEDYYVSDALLMNLDGIDKGGVDGEWRDLVGNNHFHAKTDTPMPTALDNGWEFNGIDTMMTCDDGNKVSWSPWVGEKTRTMEVVVEFTGSENKSCVFTMGGMGFAFGRITDKYILGGRERAAAMVNGNGLAPRKCVFTSVGNGVAYENGVLLSSAFSDYWLDGWTLGAADNGRYFKGIIHAIRIHDRALTEEEILYNQRIDNKRFNLGLNI
jgi:hypothetical protein